MAVRGELELEDGRVFQLELGGSVSPDDPEVAFFAESAFEGVRTSDLDPLETVMRELVRKLGGSWRVVEYVDRPETVAGRIY